MLKVNKSSLKMPGRRSSGKQFTRTQAMRTAMPESISRSTQSSSHSNTTGRPNNGFPLLFYSVTSYKLKRWPSNSLIFEGVFYLYLIVAFLCQYLFIYRTVWWYPEKIPPSSNSVNFHLIDLNLTLLLLCLFGFCFIKTFMWDGVRPKQDKLLYIGIWNLGIVSTFLLWSLEVIRNMVVLYKTVRFVQFASLCYPFILGFLCAVCFRSNILNEFTRCFYRYRFNLPPASQWLRLQSQYEYMVRSDNIECPNHEPDRVREDTQILCSDFNTRVSMIIIRACFCCYYAGFVPMFFTQHQQYFDYMWSIKHTVLILLNSAAMISMHVFSREYLDVLNKTSMLLGKFELCDDRPDTRQCSKVWSPSTIYYKSDIVVHDNRLYRAVADYNTAQPGNKSHTRFYDCFVDPNMFVTRPLILMFSTILFQLYLVVTNGFWERVISQALLLFFSYLFFFCSLRDLLILRKEREYNSDTIPRIATYHKSKSD